MKILTLVLLMIAATWAVAQVPGVMEDGSSYVTDTPPSLEEMALDPAEEAVKRWGPAAYIGIMPGVNPQMYEVGFTSIFGYSSKIIVGRGPSWDDAFTQADAARARVLSPPIGGPR